MSFEDGDLLVCVNICSIRCRNHPEEALRILLLLTNTAEFLVSILTLVLHSQSRLATYIHVEIIHPGQSGKDLVSELSGNFHHELHLYKLFATLKQSSVYKIQISHCITFRNHTTFL